MAFKQFGRGHVVSADGGQGAPARQGRAGGGCPRLVRDACAAALWPPWSLEPVSIHLELRSRPTSAGFTDWAGHLRAEQPAIPRRLLHGPIFAAVLLG